MEKKDIPFYLKELMTIKMLSPSSLKPTEQYDPSRVDTLFEKIKNEGIWQQPILIERNHSVIMDGHHRHQVAKRMNLTTIPCLIISYDSPYITVTSRHSDKDINAEDILQAGLTGILLDYKSTRHQLSIPLLSIRIPIEALMHSNSLHAKH